MDCICILGYNKIDICDFYNIIYNFKLEKIATFRTHFPCRRHNRYFNLATVQISQSNGFRVLNQTAYKYISADSHGP
jgi:hypothetical protein